MENFPVAQQGLFMKIGNFVPKTDDFGSVMGPDGLG
jgi:hypothetical protein